MADTSKEYADALFELAKESNSEKTFYEAMSLISALFAENPKYINLLESPDITEEERCNALDEAFKDKIPEYVLSFIKLLCKNKHIGEFSECFKEYEKMHMYFSKQSAAYITSAVPLNSKERSEIKTGLEQLSGHTVLPEFSVDKALIGGIIVEIDGKTIDGSIKHKLSELKEVIDK